MAKIGRNDACPCGSGQKYKRCCGPRDNAAATERAAADRAAALLARAPERVAPAAATSWSIAISASNNAASVSTLVYKGPSQA